MRTVGLKSVHAGLGVACRHPPALARTCVLAAALAVQLASRSAEDTVQVI
jgi:hypothetical protein